MLTYKTLIECISDRFDRVKLAADLKIEFSMADDKFQGSVSLCLLGLTFPADVKCKDYIRSVTRSTARKVGSL